MTRRRKLIIGGVAVLAVAAGGAGLAQAVGDDSDEQVSGPNADRAKAAAVKLVGGGQATGVESDDGGAGWEVEVRRPDGTEAEVSLTRDFKRAGVETDDQDGRENDRGEREDNEGSDSD
jgi:hypothetical protein